MRRKKKEVKLSTSSLLVLFSFFVILLIAMMVGLVGGVTGGLGGLGITLSIIIPLGLIAGIIFSGLFSRMMTELFFSTEGIKYREPHSRAKALLAQGQVEEALKEYRRILEKDPQDVEAQVELASIYEEQLEDYLRAVMEYEKALGLDPEENLFCFVSHRVADIYREHLDLPRRARQILEKIEEKFPGSPHAQRAREKIGTLEGES